MSEAITNGKVSGEVKIWYQTNEREPEGLFEKENSIFDAGVRLGYVTDTFYGFGAGINFLDTVRLWAKYAF